MLRRLVTVLSLLILLVGATGCRAAATDEVTVTSETIIVDVRTPDEFSAGHLGGARLLDLNGGQFEAELPNLDPDAEYVVYCRSGNRSAQAVKLMTAAGFTKVTDLGSMQNASQVTGIAVVK